MMSRACPNDLSHFLHPSQKYCKECGADAVTLDRYTCQGCGWSTWSPGTYVSCPSCSAVVFEPRLAITRTVLQ